MSKNLKVKVEDLPKPPEELTREQAESPQGGVALADGSVRILDGTSNTIVDGTSNTIKF